MQADALRYTFSIPCDHFQFTVEDLHAVQDSSDIWDDAAADAMVAVAPGLIAIGTVRFGGVIDLEIELHSIRPVLDFTDWDQVVECGIDVRSGQLLITHPEGLLSEASQLIMPARTYRALILFGNLQRVVDNNAATGDDHYRIVLWPDSVVMPRILKHR